MQTLLLDCLVVMVELQKYWTKTGGVERVPDLGNGVALLARMPRTARVAVGGMIDYVFHRATRPEVVFHNPTDVDVFMTATYDAKLGFGSVLELCVLCPHGDGELMR